MNDKFIKTSDGKILVNKLFDTLSIGDFEDRLDKVVSFLQKKKEYIKKRHPDATDIFIDYGYHYDCSDDKSFAIYVQQPASQAEIDEYNKQKKIQDDQQKQRRHQQYEALKKEFGE